jgi:hypothetical protein
LFECGHRSGVVVELYPGGIIKLGYLIGNIFRDDSRTFPVFAKVGDWRCYEDELLLLQPEEAAFWLIEIEGILHALQGFGNLPHDKVINLVEEFFRADLSSTLDLSRRLDDVSAKMPFARVASLRRNVQRSKPPDVESTVQKIIEALNDAAKLCRASIETRDPIRLLW